MKLKHRDRLVKRMGIVLVTALVACSCTGQVLPILKSSEIICGAERTSEYLPLISGVDVGIVANPTSRIGNVHLVDSLVKAGINVKKVFAPEHGFRGEAEAGDTIVGGIDKGTGLKVVSLYGTHKKPTPEDLLGIKVLLFDIQDVGVRFYTYISTLHYVMEACAEADLPLIVLDRPNPNAFYVDGPVLEPDFKSFVGMHPVPVVYGMTIGEYARMINGEGWLGKGLRCGLSVISCTGWDHQTEYILPVKPSPNLPDQASVYLYPSLCFFEGTPVSIGRGTPFPFKVYGHPELDGVFEFTPVPNPGASLHPLHEGRVCRGKDLRIEGLALLAARPGLILEWLIETYEAFPDKEKFFNAYFDTLAGTAGLRKMIISGKLQDEIRDSWEPGIRQFLKVRERYLLYPD
jgi:uncharacterized protein YbbC (DUF1343 family)